MAYIALRLYRVSKKKEQDSIDDSTKATVPNNQVHLFCKEQDSTVYLG